MTASIDSLLELSVHEILLVFQVLVDTERDGHRVSFNEAFKQKGRCSTTAS